jgi:hypothetical protein
VTEERLGSVQHHEAHGSKTLSTIRSAMFLLKREIVERNREHEQKPARLNLAGVCAGTYYAQGRAIFQFPLVFPV